MRLLAFALAVMVTFASFGFDSADSVKVYFRVGHSQFDPSLGDNRQVMEKCVEVLKAYAESDIDSIIIKAYTSPDGTSRTNELLARKRCDVIYDYILKETGINKDLIRKMPEGIAWNELRNLVYDTPDVPSREAVLNILDNSPVWVFDAHGKIVDGRKSRLMSLDKGIPYKWMLKNLFPKLRNAVAIVVVTKDLVKDGDESTIDNSGTAIDVDDSLTVKEPTPEISDNSEVLDKTDESAVDETVSPSEMKDDGLEMPCTEDMFALKTNLLYYAALLPNLELEWRINKRWSAAIEGDVAWYAKGLRKYRLAVVTPEVRYRVLPRDAWWHGMYVGLFVGPGIYDLENGGNGYRGEGIMTGISLGYLWPIGKRLSLEAGIGAGYIYTRYKEYRPLDGHFLYQRTKDLNYFGPLRLRLSIVWRFGHRCSQQKLSR